MRRFTFIAQTLSAALLAVAASCASVGTDRDGADTSSVPLNSHTATHQAPLRGENPAVDESTLIVDTVGALTLPDSIPLPGHFNTREAALRYMAESPDSTAYEHGILVKMLGEWLPWADRLLNSPYATFVVADKQSMRLAVFDRCGTLITSYPMAVSHSYGTKHRVGDNRTPEGFFSIKGIYDSSTWTDAETDSLASPYGPRYVSVATEGGSTIGIFGTPDANAPGQRVTLGNIRLAFPHMLDLVSYITAGTPVIINPSDRDVAVNRAEGYDIPQISIGLAVAAAGRNLSGDVRHDYPARPLSIDTASIEMPLLPDTLLIEPADTLNLIVPELAEPMNTDSLTHRH